MKSVTMVLQGMLHGMLEACCKGVVGSVMTNVMKLPYGVL